MNLIRTVKQQIARLRTVDAIVDQDIRALVEQHKELVGARGEGTVKLVDGKFASRMRKRDVSVSVGQTDGYTLFDNRSFLWSVSES